MIFQKRHKYYFKIEWRFFWEFFWGITHSSRSKNKDFRESSWFSDFFSKNAYSFSKNAYSSLKSSNFELQKCNAPQNNPQKNRHKSHAYHQFLRCPRAEIEGGVNINPPPGSWLTQNNAGSDRVKSRTICATATSLQMIKSRRPKTFSNFSCIFVNHNQLSVPQWIVSV